MANILHYLREVNTASIIIRLTLAVIFSGIIGLERGRKKRPAGLRTHILVCVGSTIVMITHEPDIARCAKRIMYIRDGRLMDEPSDRQEGAL